MTDIISTDTTVITVGTDTTSTVVVTDTVDLAVIPGATSETFVRTETKFSSYQPDNADLPLVVKGIVRTDTFVLNYYPNIIINPTTAPKVFEFLDNHWDFRQSATGPLDTTRIHVFKNDDEGLSADMYVDELGIPPFDTSGSVETAFWFTKAIPGWRSGILKYDWHWLDPLWNVPQDNQYGIPLRTGAGTGDPTETDVPSNTDASTIFIPLRGCENLRMEIYEPNRVVEQPDAYAQSAPISVSGMAEKREIYKSLVPQLATLVETVNFDRAFSFDISNNWVQFVNTGSSHAIWLEIIGGGVQNLMKFGTTFWVGNDQDPADLSSDVYPV
jgi:hypothetical protein